MKVDIKLSIPDLTVVPPFWMRDCSDTMTFQDLYQHCLNNTNIPQNPNPLVAEKIPRHFWLNRRLFQREETLHALLTDSQQNQAAQGPNPEFSLVLRRDYYGIGPGRFVRESAPEQSRDLVYLYINAEEEVENIIRKVANVENICCIELYDHAGRHIPRTSRLISRSISAADRERGALSHAGRPLPGFILPAWEYEMDSEFTAGAALTLRLRVSWQPRVLYFLAAASGGAAGWFLYALLNGMKLRG